MLSLGVGALAGIISYVFSLQFAQSSSLTKDFLSQTIVNIGHFNSFLNFMNSINVLTLWIAITLLLASSATLFHSKNPLSSKPTKTEIENKAARIAGQMKLLRIGLYASTAVLVSEILHMEYSFGWGLSYFYPTENNDVYKSTAAFVTSIINTRSIGYTLALAAVYLPAITILSAGATDLVEKAKDVEEGTGASAANAYDLVEVSKQQDWLTNRGLNSNPQDLIPRVFAILAPFLVSTSASLFVDHVKPL